jgi:hypothetical protein
LDFLLRADRENTHGEQRSGSPLLEQAVSRPDRHLPQRREAA